MTRVAIAAAAQVRTPHSWDAAAGDLAISAVAGLGTPLDIDAAFVAAPAAGPVEGQAAVGAVLADRIGIAPGTPVYEIAGGDAAGAAALHAAYAHVRAGLSSRVLVLGVAKVGDLAERERGQLLDALVDQEIEAAVGLGYMAVAGLLADLYLQRHREVASTFAQVVAKNAANAVQGGETYLRHAPSAAEVLRDLPAAPPLVRSDFAPLVDGAAALLVADLDAARELTGSPIEILSVAAAADVAAVADRADPLSFDAVRRASRTALERAGVPDVPRLALLEIDNACSVLEVLGIESLGVVGTGETGRRYRDGLGRTGSTFAINPGGGSQGRGHAFGVSGIEQVREAFLHLRGQAGSRQVEAADRGGTRTLCVAISALGSLAYATVVGTPA